MLILGAFFSAGDFVQAQRVRSVVKAETEAVLAIVDVLVTPTSTGVALKLSEPRPDSMLTRPSFTALGKPDRHAGAEYPPRLQGRPADWPPDHGEGV